MLNCSTSSLRREDRLVVLGAPAQQRHVVAQRLGQVALVAQLLHRRGAVALGELLAVLAVQQRQVRVERRLRAQRLEHEQLLGRVGEVVLAAHDVRDAGVEVVDGDGEVVEDAAVGAGDDGVVEVHVGERRVAADEVVDDGRALVGDAQAHRADVLRLAAKPAVGAVLAPCRRRPRAFVAFERYAWPSSSSCASTSWWRSVRETWLIGPSS